MSVTFTIHQAKTHLSRLIRQALAGEEVVIAKGREPLVTLSPIKTKPKSRSFGDLQGKIKIKADFDAPLDAFKDYK